jgi:hypothetical protein
MGRQRIVETPGKEDGLFRLVEMRESTAVKHHDRSFPQRDAILNEDQPTRASAADHCPVTDQGVRPTGLLRLEQLQFRP